LTAGQSQTFTIRYCPEDEGEDTCVIDCGGDCIDVVCNGTTPDPVCFVQPTTLSFDEVEIGDSRDLTFTITNTGGGTLTGTIAEICPEFSIIGSDSYSLTAGQDQSFTVLFSPDDSVDYECTIDCDNDCEDVTCTGTGGVTDPVCEIYPLSLPFGYVEVGEEECLTFLIRNVGGGLLEGFVEENCGSFNIQSGGGHYALGPGDERWVIVCFTPEFSECDPQECTILTGCQDNVLATGQGWAEEPQFDWYIGNIEICDDDSECQNASGDGDGIAERDECVCLNIGLTNIGDGTAYNVTGCISILPEDTDCYEENNECGHWPDIAPGATVYNSSWGSGFDFCIPFGCNSTPGDDLDFSLTIEYYDACTDQVYSQTISPISVPIGY